MRTSSLPNVQTYVCWEDDQRRYVLDHLDELVVKAANESGGYGMLVGPHSTAEEQREEFAGRIEAEPRNYIAQPTIGLSRAPVHRRRRSSRDGTSTCGRSSCTATDIDVLPGGLTRVALQRRDRSS